MNLYLDTSTPTAILRLSPTASPTALAAFVSPASSPRKQASSSVSDNPPDIQEYRAELGREMAEKLLAFIVQTLNDNHLTLASLTALTLYSGPGSFTGLRIGASIINALAHDLSIPLFDHHGTPQKIILPDYGRPANITI